MRWRTICLSALWLAFVFPLWAQQGNNSRRPDSGEPGLSRAEQEAEEQVSLSADRIIEILRQEPGLLLQVKKLLVREAFDQGRLLDAKDLTDEALFRLLQEDEGTRILATREIEDRAYVTTKPPREEVEREREWKAREERTYWREHDQELRRYGAPSSPPQFPGYPLPPLGPTGPQNTAPENPARVLERAGLEQNVEPSGNEWNSTGEASNSLRPMQEELPGLVNGDSRPTGVPRDSFGTEQTGNNSSLSGQERRASFTPGMASAPVQPPLAARDLSMENEDKLQEARLGYPRPRLRPPS